MINDIRRIVLSRLNDIKTEYGISEIGFNRVSHEDLYPHIVLVITTTSPTDMGRSDYILDVHVWEHDAANAYNIAEAVNGLLSFWNKPEEEILPTFYGQGGPDLIDDPDKTVIHLVSRFRVHSYESGATDSTIIWKE